MKNKSAFTLIEMAVVILIISVLMAAAIGFSRPIIKSSKVKVTNERIEAVYQALGKFIEKNYRLPCPASLLVAKGSAGYGAEGGVAGECAYSSGVYESTTQDVISYGMVPIKALGLSQDMAQDGFGNKLIYIVHDNYTIAQYPNSTYGDGFSFHKASADEMRSLSFPAAQSVDNIVLVIMSMGANGNGAFLATSTTQNTLTSSDDDEVQNYLTEITNNASPTADTASYGDNGYVGQVAITYESLASDVFDDIVLFKKRDNLFADFNIKFLEGCTSNGLGYNAGDYSTIAFFGQQIVSDDACSGSESWVYPTKECRYGDIWVNKITCKP